MSLYKDNIFDNFNKKRKEFFFTYKKIKKLLSNQYIKEMLWNEEVNDERLRTFIKDLDLKHSKSIVENISATRIFNFYIE